MGHSASPEKPWRQEQAQLMGQEAAGNEAATHRLQGQGALKTKDKTRLRMAPRIEVWDSGRASCGSAEGVPLVTSLRVDLTISMNHESIS